MQKKQAEADDRRILITGAIFAGALTSSIAILAGTIAYSVRSIREMDTRLNDPKYSTGTANTAREDFYSPETNRYATAAMRNQGIAAKLKE